jgi:hypothetical protein
MTPWIRSIPKTDGKSPSTGRKDLHRTPPSTSIQIKPPSSTLISAAGAAVPRSPARGRRPRQLQEAASAPEVEDRLQELQGTPPTKKKTPTCKSHSGCASSSPTPPAGRERKPALYTHRRSGSPRPPAAGAAGGGRGGRRDGDGEAALLRSLRKSPFSTVDGEGIRPRLLSNTTLSRESFSYE